MALVKNEMVWFFLMALIGHGFGAVFEVGDSHGWNNDSSYNYKNWAASKQFHVGDILRFVYNPLENNVMVVTRQKYETCNSVDPRSVHISGNDTFKLRKPGHFFYTCGVPGQCQAGQKVDIRVDPKASNLAPGSSPGSSPGPPLSPPPVANAPGPAVTPPHANKHGPNQTSPPSPPTAQPPLANAPYSSAPSILYPKELLAFQLLIAMGILPYLS